MASKRTKKLEVINKEFPPWEQVPFRLQTAEFFAQVRHLNNSGVNPRDQKGRVWEIVTQEMIQEVFGKDGKMKTTSPHLDPSSRRAMLRIYWQIFGTADVTNNEFGTWLVKGYIAQEMGEDVDWAAAAAATAKELDRRVGYLKCSGIELKPGASELNGGCPSANGGAGSSQLTSTELGVVSRGHLHPASASDLHLVKEHHTFLQELRKCAQRKIDELGEERKGQEEKIIGLRFNMWDRKSAASEAAEAITTAEVDLRSLAEGLGILEVQVQQKQEEVSKTDSGEERILAEESLRVVIAKFDSSKTDKEFQERQLDMSRKLLEGQRKRALQGEILYEEFQVKTKKLEGVLLEARAELGRLEREVAAVGRQIDEMKSTGGVKFLPKPLLHPPSSDILGSDSYLHVRPCGWCRRGYHCFDIAVTSCKHMFHPFCLAEAFRETSSCVVCGSTLHPEWWFSWGLRPLTSELEATALDLGVADLKETIKRSLKSALGEDIASPSGKSEALLTQGEERSTDLCGTSFKGSSYSPIGVLSWNGGLRSTPPTSPQRDNLEAQSPFRGQKAGNSSAPEDLQDTPTNVRMLSAGRPSESTDLREHLQMLEVDTISGKQLPQATSDIAKEADEAGAVDLGELKSPFYEDSVAIAEEPLPAPVSQAPVYSFSLKRKVDSSHMGSSKKQVTSDLVEGVSKTGAKKGSKTGPCTSVERDSAQKGKAKKFDPVATRSKSKRKK